MRPPVRLLSIGMDMSAMKYSKLIWLLMTALSLSFHATAQMRLVDGALGVWLLEEVSPQFSELLNNHPRFKGTRIRIMALRDGRPFPITDRLSERIKRQLTQDLLQSADVQIVYDRYQHCQPESVSTVLGIEVLRITPTIYRVVLAMVDTDEGIWLSGTNIVWQGRLDQSQQRFFAQAANAAGGTELPVAQTDEVVGALQAQLKCHRGIVAPIYFSIEDHAALRDIGRGLKQRISSRSLVTINKSDAQSILSIGVDGNSIYVELATVELPDYRSRIAAVRVNGLTTPATGSNLPAMGYAQDYVRLASTERPDRLLSDLQIADRGGVCDRRSRTCVDITFRLNEPAYLVPIYIKDGMAEVVNCRLDKRVGIGFQQYGVNVSTRSQGGSRVGFYALAFKLRSDARAVLSLLRDSSRKCRGSNRFRIPVTTILKPYLSCASNSYEKCGSGQFDWTAIHLSRDSSGVNIL